MFRRWWMVTAGITGLLGVGAAWLLARPEGPDPSAPLRVLADCLGALVLGLALLRTDLFPARHRPPVWRAAATAAGAWTIIECALLVASAGESYGAGVGRLSVTSFGVFLTDITVGQLGVVTVVCTAAACGYALAGYRRDADWSTIPLAAAAVVGLVARPITGHMSQQILGAPIVATHAVAAAVWLGVLAAMALTLRAKGAWAVMLPVYSRLAWWSVWVLLVSGIVNAVIKVGGVDGLVGTGYGRIVLAKSLLLIVIMVVARRLRTTWLVSVAAHRTNADSSTTRAAIHICLLTAAFGLAAALATTA